MPITIIAVHPGKVLTEGFKRDPSHNIPVLGPILGVLYRIFFIDPVKGSHATVFAATSPEVAQKRNEFKGAYIVRHGTQGKIGVPPHPQAESAELARELWETTESLTKDWRT